MVNWVRSRPNWIEYSFEIDEESDYKPEASDSNNSFENDEPNKEDKESHWTFLYYFSYTKKKQET